MDLAWILAASERADIRAPASESGATELSERIRTRLAFYEQQRREQKHD